MPLTVDFGAWRRPVLPKDIVDSGEASSRPILSREEARRIFRLPQGSEELDALTPPTDINGRGASLVLPISNERRFPTHCHFLYHKLFLPNLDFNSRLCCRMANVPGFEMVSCASAEGTIGARNAPALVEMRRLLKNGPLPELCRSCDVPYRFDV